MSAYLFIQGKRRTGEMRALHGVLRLAYHGDKKDVEKQLAAWALELREDT